MTLAKGLGGGVPLAALVAHRDVCCFEYGDQGGTFSGKPLDGGGRLRGDRGGRAARLPAAGAASGDISGARLARAVAQAWLRRGAREGAVAGARPQARHRERRLPKAMASGVLINSPRPGFAAVHAGADGERR